MSSPQSDLGLSARSEVAVRGVALDLPDTTTTDLGATIPLRRPGGAGPSADGHVLVDGLKTTIPINAGEPLPAARRPPRAHRPRRRGHRPGRRGRHRRPPRVLRPHDGRRRALREDRPPARRRRARDDGRPDLRALRRAGPLPVLRHRAVAAHRRHDRGEDARAARRGRRGRGPPRRRAADGADHRHDATAATAAPATSPAASGRSGRPCRACRSRCSASRPRRRTSRHSPSSATPAPTPSASTSSRSTTTCARAGCRARRRSRWRSTGWPGTRASASSAANAVSTYLIVGLGEDPDELVAGAAELVDRGVYPFVVPYRPIPGTLAFADGDPAPDPELLAEVTARVAEILRGRRHARRRPGRRLRGLRRVLGALRGGGLSVRVDPRPPRVRTEHGRRAPRRAGPPPSPTTSRSPRRRRSTPATPTSSPTGALRRAVFVDEQGLFRDDAAGDLDGHDHDPRAIVLVARDGAGEVLGGVRLAPVDPDASRPDLGWWTGSRLVVAPTARRGPASGSGPRWSVPRAPAPRPPACCGSRPTVQAANERLFARLGWQRLRDTTVAGRPHVRMRRPMGRFADLVAATKAPLGELVAGLAGSGLHVGDDGAPVPGSDLVAACDAILPAMVERDPEWAGWCGVLVNVNDLAAMGAAPVGLLDAVGARDASFAHRVLTGLRARRRGLRGAGARRAHPARGARRRSPSPRWAATASPVPGGGGRPGHGGPADRRPRRHLAPGLHRSPVGLHVDARARRPARDGRGDRAGRAPPARGRQGRLDGRGRRDARHARRGLGHRRGARRRGRPAPGRRDRRPTG